MSLTIRSAHATEFASLVSLEERADAILVEYLGATSWPNADPDRSAQLGFTLVAEMEGVDEGNSTLVGFAQVLLPDGLAHLEQLSVLPEHGRRGIGGALLEATVTEARGRGFAELTLRTYADVPWNAPFYARHGFVESDPDSDFHRMLVTAEARLGLERYGRRVQMTRVL
ncbi:GNAT family N-acetyltransferase [Leucobacter salsicius]|uniref:GNAT family N-acetyltransferase n=1 Tax=Leucobacter salsicius TaxID=664638 RepID=UPI00034DFF4D|nr:GNAT family N-acetyltransferase [Leucobacter salsicius]